MKKTPSSRLQEILGEKGRVFYATSFPDRGYILETWKRGSKYCYYLGFTYKEAKEPLEGLLADWRPLSGFPVDHGTVWKRGS